MNRIVAVCTAVILLMLLSPASAAVFERDWMTEGDGLLTYDDVNRREWLDLSVSRLDQFPQPRLENAIAEIAPGGLFDGFTFAKRKDVIRLAQSAGVDVMTMEPSINETSISGLIELLSITFQAQPSVRSIGFIDELQETRQVGADFFLSRGFNNGPFQMAGLDISASNDLLQLGSTGLMLFRVVPEPSTIWMLTLSLFFPMFARRRNHS